MQLKLKHRAFYLIPMRLPPLLLVFLFVFAACNTTERIVHFPEEQMGTQLPSNGIAALQAEYGNIDGVYLQYNQSLEHNVSIAFTSTIPS